MLSCALLAAGWHAAVLYSRIHLATSMSGECARVERNAASESDPLSLALEIQWLEIYYRLNHDRLSGSPLHGVIQRDYERTLTKSFAVLSRLTTNDFEGDLASWLARQRAGEARR